MIAYIAAMISSVAILYRPLMLAYLLLLYMFMNGLASRAVATNLKLSVGHINIFMLDYLFAMMVLLMIVGWGRMLLNGDRERANVRAVHTVTLCVMLFLAYQLLRFALGYFDNIPVDSLVRMFYPDFQAVYFFLPLFFLHNERQFRRIFLVVVGFALIYPAGQVLFASREDAAWMLQGQGTYRLGFGDSAIPLGIGLLAIYVWDKRYWLMAIPAIGLVMLAHRSAFVAIVVALIAAAILKGKTFKAIGIMVLVAGLAGVLLLTVQHFTQEALFEHGVERLGQTFQSTGTTMARIQSIPYMFGIWLENPLLGVDYHTLYQTRESLVEGDRTSALLHPHNFVLRALVQYGAIGAGLLFTIIGYSLLVARRIARVPGLQRTGVFLFSSQLYFLIFATMNTTMGTAGYFYWIMVGSTFWYIRRAYLQWPKTVPLSRQATAAHDDRILARKKPQTRITT